MIEILNYINGEFIAPLSSNFLNNFEPATGKIYAKLPDSHEGDIELAYQAAQGAFAHWAGLLPEERSKYLYKIADLIEANAQVLAEAESRDQGKPVHLALNMDVKRAALNFRFFAGAILHHENKSQELGHELLSYTTRRPLGVVGLISPWNLPLYLLTWKIAPALACGNTVIAKPSELTPMTAFLLADILNQAQLPPGVCNIIFGLGPTAGSALVRHPKVPAISFTGGTATGEILIRESAPYFKRLSLELGGKNPNIVFADADLESCIQTSVRSSFLNQGEICLCGSRIYVEKNIYSEFVQGFVQEVEKLRVGDPRDPQSFMGALISQQHLEKVERYIALAKSEGGKILTGGRRPELPKDLANGYFLMPTVVADLPQDCLVMQEEIFGPVVTLSSFETESEVIQKANAVKYGLSASVWTQNVNRAHRVAQTLQVGNVWINTWMQRDLRVPFGGMKASGLGREGGEHSLDFFTEAKNISLKIV